MITVRTAEISDLDFIMKVEAKGFIPQIQEKREVFRERLLKCPESFLIIEREGEEAGYLCAEFLQKVPERPEEISLGHSPTGKKGPYLYISSFSVLPEFRGNHTGTMAFEKSVNHFCAGEGISSIVLLVNETWKGARAIYEKSGFSTIKIFNDFFPDEKGGFTAGILMQKNL